MLNEKYGLRSGEYHYSKIKPLIMAEEYLDSKYQSFKSNSLIDYKMWCINGKFQLCMVMYDRTKTNVKASLFDKNWNNIEGLVPIPNHLAIGEYNLPCPKNWEQMKIIAETLSKPFIESRIDLYEVYGNIYFGEITLTSAAGRMKYFTKELLQSLGKNIELS